MNLPTTIYQATIYDTVTRAAIKQFAFDNTILKSRTPLAAAWDIAAVLVRQTQVHVKLHKS